MAWNCFINTIDAGSPADRIIGMIYGHALGDAVGLPMEYQKPAAAKFPYTDPVREFEPCDWSEDTDHLIIVMKHMVDNDFEFDARLIAADLKKWSIEGFSKIGDKTGLGLSNTTKFVFDHPEFTNDPKTAADDIWASSNGKFCTNGSLMRTDIVGVIPDSETIAEWASELSQVTHTDHRCISCCVFQSLIIGELIYSPVSSPGDVDNLLASCANVARKYLGSSDDGELSTYVQTAYTRDIAELKLADMVGISSAFKALSCSIYSLQVIKSALIHNKTPSFKKVILKLASACGDANTNCALAGGTLGCYLGYSKLPKEWIDAMPHVKWFNTQIMDFIYKLRSSFGRG